MRELAAAAAPLLHLRGMGSRNQIETLVTAAARRACEQVKECEAVDLHVGRCVRIEAQPDTLRVDQGRGGCGNTVARLVSNLQHHIDGALSMQDPELDALLKLDYLYSLV